MRLSGDFQPFSSSPATGDLITIKGQDYTVRKFDKPSLGTTPIKTMLYVSR